VAKHFPGHGDTFEDSHLNLAVAPASADELAAREFKPFAQCAFDFPAMLVGHVWLPAYEDVPLPASLSRRVIEDILRRQLKFDGYLFTDDMPVMKAIVDNWGLEEACVMAVAAGADNVLVSGTGEQIYAVHTAIVKALENGHIKEDRLHSSLRRRKAAMDVTCGASQYRREARQQLAASIGESRDSMLQLSIAAITAVRDANSRLGDGEWIVVAPRHPRYALDLYKCLKDTAQAEALNLSERRYELNPDSSEIDAISAAVRGKNCLLITFRALLNEGQMQLADSLCQVSKKRIVVASDVPYELALLSKWETCLATFDPSDLAMQALSTLLLQGLPARGKMPVSLGDVAPPKGDT
jgi:beta-N-acetylhexosaminidase